MGFSQILSLIIIWLKPFLSIHHLKNGLKANPIHHPLSIADNHFSVFVILCKNNLWHFPKQDMSLFFSYLCNSASVFGVQNCHLHFANAIPVSNFVICTMRGGIHVHKNTNRKMRME
jgi:hypothetical protein